MGCNLKFTSSFLLSSGRPLGDLKQELSEAFANLPPDNLTLFSCNTPLLPASAALGSQFKAVK